MGLKHVKRFPMELIALRPFDPRKIRISSAKMVHHFFTLPIRVKMGKVTVISVLGQCFCSSFMKGDTGSWPFSFTYFWVADQLER